MICLALLTACAVDSGRHPSPAQAWQDSNQMLLVLSADWDASHGRLYSFERNNGTWIATAEPAPVVLGRSGSAWGLGLNPAQQSGPIKREGDGRSPAGVFAIGTAFGYSADAETALPYAPMRASSWCVDVSGSPLYNRIVDSDSVGEAAVKGASERMRLDLLNADDQRYRLGFLIQHNTQQQAMAGSCIFAHLWKSADTTTAGCTAMQASTMQRLLHWLDPKQQPLFVLLPNAEYQRLRDRWQLPTLELKP